MLTHIDKQGNAIMSDISDKEITQRIAVAKGKININNETISAIKEGTIKKGDVFAVARIAGIMALKKIPHTIPLCHTILIDSCSIDFSIDEKNQFIEASCTVKTTGKTGAEMEALTGASTALLTIYDMCKSIDKKMILSDIRITEKSGGKSGHYKNA
jgi:cyclic pyranopterin phosphate synthase